MHEELKELAARVLRRYAIVPTGHQVKRRATVLPKLFT